MYGSYGSYSSMSLTTAPMDITSRSLQARDATCAFPSWPRRSSLSESDHDERPTSYLSDDDLFLSDPFEEDARSVSSGSSSPAVSPPHEPSEEELFQMQRERLALQQQYIRAVISEKERRRAAMKKQSRRGSSGSSSKKSPKSKLSSMTPIAEATE